MGVKSRFFQPSKNSKYFKKHEMCYSLPVQKALLCSVCAGRGRPYRKNQEAFSVYLFCRHLFLAHGTLSRIVQVSNTLTEDGYSYTYVLLHHCNSHMLNRLPMLTSKVVEADHSRVRLISLHWVMTLCVSLSTPVSLSERLVNLCLSLLLNSHHTSRFSECSHFI